MAYYHDLIVEKSWKELQALRKKYDFILIGGWAVYLYTKALKSRDIDFICSYETLEKLKTDFDLVKNERLKKYEIHRGNFDIDIYVPHFSELGIPVADLQTMKKSLEGFTVLKPEPLLILKQIAFQERGHSIKGEKDKIDMLALLMVQAVDFEKYRALLENYQFIPFQEQLRQLIAQTRAISELGVDEHAFSRFKKRVMENFSKNQ